MRSLFKGPVPINEEQNVKDAFRDMLFDSETSETISFTNYMRVMDRLRSDAEQFERSLEGKLKPTCQFTSLSSLQETTKRCGLVTMKLQEKQLTALTSAQQYGWERVKLERPVAGRGQSDITKFQSELIKNGVYY